MNSYRDLIVWKAAVELAVDCYSVTKAFPSSEIYGMTSQMRRSSVSIAANIAEGHGRESTGSFIQFLRMAQGSLKELETHLILSEKVGLMVEAEVVRLLSKADEIGKMLRSMIRSLQQKS
ncbi:four helix bundle protein [Mesorhizobium sp. M7A.F.Ca.CA.001.07.2.1]|uniref:four helix bundle protein n=3 Tax=Phyllobacteriaceae TaxID=69277 RepID=UPI000FCC0A0D|nr:MULTISPECIES: four helix bundle protein [Mesorhizobium]MCQ8815584.1 four helix bundle protein [Mesorhizobium sp. SEMIA396]RUU62300.1 four helix bundle protein [Mesorhizobium sp. M7A.T.Ca.TU.009.01.1.1]RUU83841.1 four helix bundle protein [Mesorhizobium sp. M7A.T.Ca.TU.009.01.1.2]RVB47296.1 four helix bundle protein [Mesorhizobium sp. M7A.F.Ca.CA.004.05.1.1]RWN20351.1 MAG: four helix bundle protein [Mesorhizobium sp.]